MKYTKLGFIRPAHAHVWVASTSNLHPNRHPRISHLQGHPKVFKVAIPLDVAFQFLSFHHIPQGTCSCYRCESLWIAESDIPAFPAFPALLSIACEDVNPGPADHPKTAQGPARARGRVFGTSRRVLSARRAETATESKQSKLQSGMANSYRESTNSVISEYQLSNGIKLTTTFPPPFDPNIWEPSSGHCVVQVWKIRRDPMEDASEPAGDIWRS